MGLLFHLLLAQGLWPGGWGVQAGSVLLSRGRGSLSRTQCNLLASFLLARPRSGGQLCSTHACLSPCSMRKPAQLASCAPCLFTPFFYLDEPFPGFPELPQCHPHTSQLRLEELCFLPVSLFLYLKLLWAQSFFLVSQLARDVPSLPYLAVRVRNLGTYLLPCERGQET